MKRLSLHTLFALSAVAAAGAVALQGARLQQALALNQSLAAASRIPAASSGAASAVPAPDAPREVRLARATALSQAGEFDAAFKLFSGLIEPGQGDALGRHAQYNLGNMYLRQALGSGPPAGTDAPGGPPATDHRPLVELAKQRYRDLLRMDPGDWDARYNLERALRTAPEEQAAEPEDNNLPAERRSVMLRGMNAGDLP